MSTRIVTFAYLQALIVEMQLLTLVNSIIMKNLKINILLICLLSSLNAFAGTFMISSDSTELSMSLDKSSEEVVSDSTEIVSWEKHLPAFMNGLKKIMKWSGKKVNSENIIHISKTAEDYCDLKNELPKPFTIFATRHLYDLINKSFLGLEPINHNIKRCWICTNLLCDINEK